jgi:hypothetical protein
MSPVDAVASPDRREALTASRSSVPLQSQLFLARKFSYDLMVQGRLKNLADYLGVNAGRWLKRWGGDIFGWGVIGPRAKPKLDSRKDAKLAKNCKNAKTAWVRLVVLGQD